MSKLLINGVTIKDYFYDTFKRFQYMSASMFNKIDECDKALKYIAKMAYENNENNGSQRWDLYEYEYKELRALAYMGAKHLGGLKNRIEEGKVINDFNSIVHLIDLDKIECIDPIQIRTPLAFDKPICDECKKLNETHFEPEILFDPNVYYEEEHLRYYEILTAFIQDCYIISGGGLWYTDEAKKFAQQNKEKLTADELKFFRGFVTFGTAATNFAYVARECFAQNIIAQHNHFNIKKPKEIFMNAYMTNPPKPFPDGVYIINKEKLCMACSSNLRNDVVNPLELTEEDIF